MVVVRTCRNCGTPKAIIRRFRWRDDGIIELKPKGFRGEWIEINFYWAILTGLEELLQISLEKIVIEAWSNHAKYVTDDMMSGLPGKILRLRPLRRFAVLYMLWVGRVYGMLKAELFRHDPGVQWVLRCEYLSQPAFMAANLLGVFRSLEGVNGVVEYEKTSDGYLVEIHASEEAKVEERLRIEQPATVPARVNYESCPA